MVSLNIEKPCPQFLIGFTLINIYIPGYIGASIPTGWLFLLIVIPFCIANVEVRLTTAHLTGFLFLLYAFVSLAWTPILNLGFSYFIRVVIAATIFCLASGLKDVRWFIIGIVIGLIPSDILAFLQKFADIKPVYSINSDVAGLFINPNIYCEISAAIFLALLCYRLWFLIPLTIPAIAMVHSRGALVGLFAGSCIWLFKRNKDWFYIIVASSIIGGIYYYKDHFVMSSVNERFDMWLDALSGFKAFGNGIGSFETMYPYYATHIDTAIARPRFLHNDLFNFIFELGLGATLLIWFLTIIYKVRSNERFVLIGIGLMSAFSYSLNVSVIGFLWVLLAGFASHNLPNVRIVGDSLRPDLSKRFAR